MKVHLIMTAFLWMTMGTSVFAQPKDDLKIWYDRPAGQNGLASPERVWEQDKRKNPDQAWEKYILPLGNGFLGAVLYGGMARERIQLNEHSVWTGGPGMEGYCSPDRPDAHRYLDQIRKALRQGDTDTDKKLRDEHLRGGWNDDNRRGFFGRYQTFGEIYIDTDIDEASVAGYHRELDLRSGVARVLFQHKGTEYRREVFCSYPDRVLVIRFSANTAGKQNLRLSMATPYALKASVEDGVFALNGKIAASGLRLSSRLGGAWLCQHVWEHFVFTQDKLYLRDMGYPILKGQAEFIATYLSEDKDGTLVCSPSWSPEHDPISAGCTSDQSIAWDLLNNAAEAAKILNVPETSVSWLLRKGQLPRRKIAGKIRFTLEDLQALIDASAVTQCCATEQKGAN